MAGRTKSDTTVMQDDPKKIKINTGIGVHEIPTAEEIMETVNKATAFMRDMPEVAVPAHPGARNVAYSADTGRSTSQFNIIGGHIGQAAIGNTGPVVFNQKSKVFEKGSSNTNYKISGGNFSQANLGGTAQYNNKGSNISAVSGGAGFAKISPEDLTLHILERGVTIEQFRKLLEMEYSLVNIAFALPKNGQMRDRMVNALIAGADTPMEA